MYRLYYFPGNANLAPHMCLQEIGADYELALVDRAVDGQKDPEYMRLNPAGRIPTLVDGDLVLFESAAICLHLADRHPAAGLAPPLGGAARAHFYKWLMFLTNTIQPDVLGYHYTDRYTTDPAAVPAVKAAFERRLGDWYGIVDAALAEGPYLLGETFSAADLYLFMVARWGRALTAPPGGYAHLGPFLRRLAERPCVVRAFEAEGLAAPYYRDPA
ncbi:MAG: glutathione S-transferase N-terminal domain-containing protein [Hyphomicrobiales bacterium]|nr:glutathione S-transferase N-terminal domain-containing protein [Hyphomicrobiales bacterium]